MRNKVKDKDIKNHTYYPFNDIINTRNFDPSNNKLDENSSRIFLSTTLDM